MHVWLIATPVNKAFVLIIETFILEHKHTLFRKRPMKAFKVIKSPEAFQLLADETRRRIIYLLRAKEMTVSQISAELGLTPQAIYHHIRKMRDADFFVKQGITHLAKLLTMTDKEFTEYLGVEREYRKLLRSLLEGPTKLEALARKA